MYKENTLPAIAPLTAIIPLHKVDNVGLRDAVLSMFQTSYSILLKVRLNPDGETFLQHVAPLRNKDHLSVMLLRVETVDPYGRIGGVIYRAVAITPSGELRTLKEDNNFIAFVDWVGELIRGEVV